VGEKALGDLPSFLIVVGFSTVNRALVGRRDKAKQAMRQFRQLDPTQRLSIKDWLLFNRSEDLATSRMACEEQAIRNDSRMSADGTNPTALATGQPVRLLG
jgi:hypothetical protein